MSAVEAFVSSRCPRDTVVPVGSACLVLRKNFCGRRDLRSQRMKKRHLNQSVLGLSVLALAYLLALTVIPENTADWGKKEQMRAHTQPKIEAAIRRQVPQSRHVHSLPQGAWTSKSFFFKGRDHRTHLHGYRSEVNVVTAHCPNNSQSTR